MRLIAALFLAFLTLAVAQTAWPAHAQPELEEADPPEGSTLEIPPLVRLCFSETITGQFRIVWEQPDGGLRGATVLFDPNARCLDIEPILPAGAVGGEYILNWTVASEATNEQASGSLSYQIGETGQPLPLPSPTAEPSPTPAQSPGAETPTATGTPTDQATPVEATPTPSGTPSASPTPAPEDDEDDGTDILVIALITAGTIGGVAALGLLLFLLRRRLGFEPHEPPEGQSTTTGGDDH